MSCVCTIRRESTGGKIPAIVSRARTVLWTGEENPLCHQSWSWGHRRSTASTTDGSGKNSNKMVFENCYLPFFTSRWRDVPAPALRVHHMLLFSFQKRSRLRLWMWNITVYYAVFELWHTSRYYSPVLLTKRSQAQGGWKKTSLCGVTSTVSWHRRHRVLHVGTGAVVHGL